MNTHGSGDLAQTLMLRRLGGGLRQTVARIGGEIASGQYADTARALCGNLMQLASVEQGLVQAARHSRSAKFGATLLAAQQNALEQISQITNSLAPDLRMTMQATSPDAISAAGERARAGFEDAIGLLNMKVAGRHIFAGVAGDQRPFAEPQAILDALASGLPTAPSPSDITSHVASWFATGGPFDSLGYLGHSAPNGAIDLGDGNSIRLDVTGADQGLRESLAALALGALIAPLTTQMQPSDRRALLAAGSDAMIASTDSRIATQARIGTQEARAANALARAEAKAAAFQIIRTELREADPYERATALEAATQKLDALYLVTARLSRLSLTEYLR